VVGVGQADDLTAHDDRTTARLERPVHDDRRPVMVPACGSTTSYAKSGRWWDSSPWLRSSSFTSATVKPSPARRWVGRERRTASIAASAGPRRPARFVGGGVAGEGVPLRARVHCARGSAALHRADARAYALATAVMGLRPAGPGHVQDLLLGGVRGHGASTSLCVRLSMGWSPGSRRQRP
jgi:hypothetical protein